MNILFNKGRIKKLEIDSESKVMLEAPITEEKFTKTSVTVK